MHKKRCVRIALASGKGGTCKTSAAIGFSASSKQPDKFLIETLNNRYRLNAAKGLGLLNAISFVPLADAKCSLCQYYWAPLIIAFLSKLNKAASASYSNHLYTA